VEGAERLNTRGGGLHLQPRIAAGHLPRHVARSHWYRRNRQKGGQGTGQNIAPYTTRTHIPLYPSSVHPDHQDSLLYI
jgi:hypothetical protein